MWFTVIYFDGCNGWKVGGDTTMEELKAQGVVIGKEYIGKVPLQLDEEGMVLAVPHGTGRYTPDED